MKNYTHSQERSIPTTRVTYDTCAYTRTPTKIPSTHTTGMVCRLTDTLRVRFESCVVHFGPGAPRMELNHGTKPNDLFQLTSPFCRKVVNNSILPLGDLTSLSLPLVLVVTFSVHTFRRLQTWTGRSTFGSNSSIRKLWYRAFSSNGFAEYIGISVDFLSLIERGRNAPSFETIDPGPLSQYSLLEVTDAAC